MTRITRHPRPIFPIALPPYDGAAILQEAADDPRPAKIVYSFYRHAVVTRRSTRPVRDRGAARKRGDGRRLSRARQPPAARGRPKDDGRRGGQRRGQPRPLRPGDTRRRRVEPPQHPGNPRFRHAQRGPLRCHRAARRGNARRPAADGASCRAPRAAESACQIAEGLAAAHAKGVIHRDIKPENIFLTHEGRSKILDFGIARIEKLATLSPSPASQKSSSAILIGTAGYVSPEQIRGRRADAGSDVFGLGAVYYEMLTGRRAFVRQSPVETLGAVLRDDPRKYPETAKVPAALQPILFRCLEKDPADRYQYARDVLL